MLERKPFDEIAKTLFRAITQQQIEGFVSATAIKDVYYFARKQSRDKNQAISVIKDLLKVMNICEVNRQTLERAIARPFKDYEDAIQVAVAEREDLDVIVTRNLKDFKGSVIPVLLPEVLIAQV